MLSGSTVVRAEIWSVLELVTPSCVISLIAVVTANDVVTRIFLVPSFVALLPSKRSSTGCQVGGVLHLEAVEGEVADPTGRREDPLRAGAHQVDLLAADVGAAQKDRERRSTGDRPGRRLDRRGWRRRRGGRLGHGARGRQCRQDGDDTMTEQGLHQFRIPARQR